MIVCRCHNITLAQTFLVPLNRRITVLHVWPYGKSLATRTDAARTEQPKAPSEQGSMVLRPSPQDSLYSWVYLMEGLKDFVGGVDLEGQSLTRLLIKSQMFLVLKVSYKVECIMKTNVGLNIFFFPFIFGRLASYLKVSSRLNVSGQARTPLPPHPGREPGSGRQPRYDHRSTPAWKLYPLHFS